MSKRVIFFGAGLSGTFGFPVTKYILPGIIGQIVQYRSNQNSWLYKEEDSNQKFYMELLEDLLCKLSPGIKNIIAGRPSSAQLHKLKSLPLVTDLLSQLDHWIVSSQDISDWNFKEDYSPVRKMTTLTERIDLKVLKNIFEWAIISVIGQIDIEQAKGPDKLFSYIRRINSNPSKSFITTITTNYDSLIEWNLIQNRSELNRVSSLIDYGFSWREPITNEKVYLRPRKPKFKVFKLHGSVDWLKCERCGHIYINPFTQLYQLAYINEKNEDNSCHCDYWPLKPVIVTPSYIRSVFDTNLHEIWKASIEELRTADEWIIIGYSLPNEDFNIKSLFLRALNGRANKPKITVVQFGDEAKSRFKNFFGTEKLTYHNKGLEAYVKLLLPEKKKSK
jgi:NAD-dependent SIR2 family protein deacetylase